MVYDPSAKSRSASGVFPRGFPSTSTSASAGVDRTSTLPVCARRTAPDAGRDGLGAMELVGAWGALGALGAPGALGAVGAIGAGRSTIVESTPDCLSATGAGRGERRNNPTESAARTAKTRNIAMIDHRRLGSSGSASLTCNARGGCAAQDVGNGGGGGVSSSSSRSSSGRTPGSMTRSSGSLMGSWGSWGSTGAASNAFTLSGVACLPVAISNAIARNAYVSGGSSGAEY